MNSENGVQGIKRFSFASGNLAAADFQLQHAALQHLQRSPRQSQWHRGSLRLNPGNSFTKNMRHHQLSLLNADPRIGAVFRASWTCRTGSQRKVQFRERYKSTQKSTLSYKKKDQPRSLYQGRGINNFVSDRESLCRKMGSILYLFYSSIFQVPPHEQLRHDSDSSVRSESISWPLFGDRQLKKADICM